eukprot:TRINITY_DN20065_c0_g1_i1.p1 TRINITY_DN20065_c0_g1~~TRINITY_DN20065_c0_g1_i1.p1  ORF type:complete len:368 (-),score=99.72 TRINITY_DN20065_c0_g1_i1:189-1292(-)
MTACVTTAPVATRMHGSGGGYGATDALQRASRDSVASAGCSEVSPELQKKALEKEEIVRRIIQNIERALKNNRDQDRQWLQAVCDPSDACFRTLVQLAVEPKYEVFVRLRCCALRAVQMLLRVAVTMVQEGRAEFASDASIGLRLFKEMAGDKLALQAFPIILDAARKHETPLLACDCLFVLAELGPEALAEHELLLRMLDLFVVLSERADELVEVACRIHAWGGELRSQLLQAAAAHRGGKLMCEVLIQMINRADTMRKLRATKVLTGCLSMPSGETLLYTNDARVLVEILLRDLQNTADDVVSFTLFSDCLKAVISASDALRQEDKRQEFIKVLTMLQEDETVPPDVRQVAANVLAVGMAKVNAT